MFLDFLLLFTSIAIFTILSSFFAAQVMRSYDLTGAVGNRSVCDNCGKKLRVIDLIPVLSFLWLRGKCANCQVKIDRKIWLSEILGLLVAIPFFVILQREISQFQNFELGNMLFALISFVVFGLMLYLAIADLFTYTIPTNWTLALTLILLSVNALALVINRTSPSLGLIEFGNYQNLLAAVLYGAGIYLIVKITKEQGIGQGDIYLAISSGLYLGWPKVLSAFYIMVITALIVGIIMAISRRKFKGTIVPLVPFFLLGLTYAAAFGMPIFDLLFPGLFIWL